MYSSELGYGRVDGNLCRDCVGDLKIVMGAHGHYGHAAGVFRSAPTRATGAALEDRLDGSPPPAA